MKKNVMMRVASVLLIAVMMTTCAISGTFAKYVTSAEGSDSARVAKWGVKVTAQGPSNFSNEYKTHENDFTGALSVKSIDDAKVVAPGTSSEDIDDDTVFTITGTPEVATRVTLSVAEGYSDIFLKAGTYTDFTKVVGYGDDNIPLYATFTLENDYYPVVWTLTVDDTSENVTDKQLVQGNLEAIVKFLDDYVDAAEYDPNEVLDATFTLTWAWAFEGAQTLNNSSFSAEIVDKADTWLGNAAAGLFYDTVQNTDYSVNIGYEVTLTVTQID